MSRFLRTASDSGSTQASRINKLTRHLRRHTQHAQAFSECVCVELKIDLVVWRCWVLGGLWFLNLYCVAPINVQYRCTRGVGCRISHFIFALKITITKTRGPYVQTPKYICILHTQSKAMKVVRICARFISPMRFSSAIYLCCWTTWLKCLLLRACMSRMCEIHEFCLYKYIVFSMYRCDEIVYINQFHYASYLRMKNIHESINH